MFNFRLVLPNYTIVKNFDFVFNNILVMAGILMPVKFVLKV